MHIIQTSIFSKLQNKVSTPLLSETLLSAVHSPKSVVQPCCQIQTESFISVNVLFFSVKFELRGQKKPFEMNQSSFSSVVVTEGNREVEHLVKYCLVLL